MSYLYIAVRVDRRFHIPNGSKRAGDYSGRNEGQDKEDSLHSEGQIERRVMSEEEVFDDEEFCDCEEGPLKDLEAQNTDVERQDRGADAQTKDVEVQR